MISGKQVKKILIAGTRVIIVGSLGSKTTLWKAGLDASCWPDHCLSQCPACFAFALTLFSPLPLFLLTRPTFIVADISWKALNTMRSFVAHHGRHLKSMPIGPTGHPSCFAVYLSQEHCATWLMKVIVSRNSARLYGAARRTIAIYLGIRDFCAKLEAFALHETGRVVRRRFGKRECRFAVVRRLCCWYRCCCCCSGCFCFL